MIRASDKNPISSLTLSKDETYLYYIFLYISFYCATSLITDYKYT